MGRVSLPLYVTEDEPYRPDVVLCLSGKGLVGLKLISPDTTDEEVAGEVAAMTEAPAIGRPLLPRRIRVASPSLREALQGRFGPDVYVQLEATPSIDAAVADLVEHMAEQLPPGSPTLGKTYFHGPIEPSDVAGLFAAAARVYRTAPWKIFPDDASALGLDVPLLDAMGMRVIVIGQLGESRAILVFRGDSDLEAMSREASSPDPKPVARNLLSIAFEREDGIPPELRGEIEEHGWPVSAPDAYPVVMRFDADGVPRPLTGSDILSAQIVATAVALFFEEHPGWIDAPVVERFTLDDVKGHPEVIVSASPTPSGVASASRPAATRHDLTGVPPSSDAAILRLSGDLWGPEFDRRFPREVDAAHELVAAVVERSPGLLREEVEQRLGSLPLFWARFHRPMRDGRTGAEVAGRWSRLRSPAQQATLARIVAARGVYAEIVDLTSARVLCLRDLFDGTLYRVPIGPRVASISDSATRWLRVFGVLVDVGDGTWSFPSTLVAYGAFDELSPAMFLERARSALELIGVDPQQIDPAAPHRGLARWSAVVSASMLALPPRPREIRRLYLVNSDGDPIEVHDATFALSRKARERLLAALDRAPDVSRGGGTYSWISHATTSIFKDGEAVAQLDAKPKLCLHTNSSKRHAKYLALVAELAGEPPEVRSLEVMRPWEADRGVAREEGPDTERLVIGACVYSLEPGERAPDLAGVVRASLSKRLSEPVPSLGGAPKDLMSTKEGRAKVEAWLREAELKGLGEGAGQVKFLDLDPLRDELGLPRVVPREAGRR